MWYIASTESKQNWFLRTFRQTESDWCAAIHVYQIFSKLMTKITDCKNTNTLTYNVYRKHFPINTLSKKKINRKRFANYSTTNSTIVYSLSRDGGLRVPFTRRLIPRPRIYRFRFRNPVLTLNLFVKLRCGMVWINIVNKYKATQLTSSMENPP